MDGDKRKAGSGDAGGASATMAYKAGDVIVACQPFVHLLATEMGGRANKPTSQQPQLLPDECRSFWYCSQACQREDWKSFHKHGECKLYKQATDKSAVIPEDAKLAVRLYLMIKAQPGLRKKQLQLHAGGSRSLDDLMDHLNEMAELSYFVSQSIKRLVAIDSQLMHDKALLSEMIHKLQINKFVIKDWKEETFGSGLFIEASVFNHSCRPNAALVFDGKDMQVRAMTDIVVGEEITVQYGGIMYPKQYRRKYLREGFNFTCRCQRCLGNDDEEEAADLAVNNEHDYCSIDADDPDAFAKAVRKLLTVLPIKHKYLGPYHPVITQFMLTALYGISATGIRDEEVARDVMQLVRKLKDAARVTNYGPVPMFERLAPLIAAVDSDDVAHVIRVSNQLSNQFMRSSLPTPLSM